jgi:hypothetical protein
MRFGGDPFCELESGNPEALQLRDERELKCNGRRTLILSKDSKSAWAG